MSRRHTAKLDDQCLSIEHDPGVDPCAVQVRPLCFEWLRDAGHPIEDVRHFNNTVSVKTDDENCGYLVCKIDTLEKPLPIADAVEDEVTIWVCSCPDYHHRQFPDLSESERPSEARDCPHITKTRKKIGVNK